MDVYKYIRSKDVREYNKKIKHEFNTLESTFLVWRNYDISLCEKHEAWRQICSEMPDTEIKKRLNVDYAPSLYELIELFIKTDKFLINEFYREDDCAIYGYRFYCEGDNGWSEDFRTPYSCFEKLKKALEEDFDLPIVAIEYRKQYLNSEWKNIVLSIKKDGTVMNVSMQGFEDDFLKDNSLKDKEEFFEGLWIDVPTPFKVGDIVCSKKTPFGYSVYNGEQPFVLTYIANWSRKDSLERGDKTDRSEWQDERITRWKESGDSSDMIANGYFLATDYNDRYTGDFYDECMHDYTDLEYYRGEFVGGERVLLPVSYFVKGEIGEETFIKACEIIKKQEEVKENVRCLGILDEWVKKLGIE